MQGTTKEGLPCILQRCRFSVASITEARCIDHCYRFKRWYEANAYIFIFGLVVVFVPLVVKGVCLLIDHYSLPKQWRWATKKELVSLAEVWEIRRQCEELFPDGYILFYVDGEYDVHCQRGLRQIANVEFDMTKTYVNQDPEDAPVCAYIPHIIASQHRS